MAFYLYQCSGTHLSLTSLGHIYIADGVNYYKLARCPKSHCRVAKK